MILFYNFIHIVTLNQLCVFILHVFLSNTLKVGICLKAVKVINITVIIIVIM